MEETKLFQAALGLQPPWFVKSCSFDVDEKQLDVYLDFAPGAEFRCPHCGRSGCKAHDTLEKTWRHLNFFEHKAYLHARTPRIECPECGVKLVEVPSARPGAGFTLLFEAPVMGLAKEMPVNAIPACGRQGAIGGRARHPHLADSASLHRGSSEESRHVEHEQRRHR